VTVIRQAIGETIRSIRLRQRRTLREVSTAARVSLGYLSEIERGQKEASSELLAAICAALGVQLSEVFTEVSDTLRREEKLAERARFTPVGPPAPHLGAPASGAHMSTVGGAPMRRRVAA